MLSITKPKRMFKVFITETLFKSIISREELLPSSDRSNLRKLIMQWPVQQLSDEDTDRIKAHPGEVLKHPSVLYIMNITYAEALDIQKSFGVMCLRADNPNISSLIDVSDIHTPKKGKPFGCGLDSVQDCVEYFPTNGLIKFR